MMGQADWKNKLLVKTWRPTYIDNILNEFWISLGANDPIKELDVTIPDCFLLEANDGKQD